MGFFDRLRDGLGVQREPPAAAADEQAIARYRYLLKTAPPETIEQAHAEAFAQLTPEQRQQVLQELAAAVPEGGERNAVMRAGDSPDQLARVATRAEMRQPGLLERIFGPSGPSAGMAGPGLGSMFAGTFLSSMAGTVLGSMIAQQFFHSHTGGAGLFGDGGHEPSPASSQLSTDAPGSLQDDPWSQGNAFDPDAVSGDFDSGFDSGSTDV